MITAVDCTIIRTNEHLLPEFLQYYQLSNIYLKDVDSRTTGTTRSRISRKNLGIIEIPIPPLDEQKRIVAKLDECFEAIDKARANVEKNLNNAKELFQSQLNQIFSQKGDGLVEKNLGEVCEKTYNIKWQENQDVELEYIDLSAVSRETLKITETVSINSSNAPSRAKKIIKTGDIIFATTRPTLKRVAKISNQYNNQICSTGYVVLRSRDEMIKPEIIFYYIQTDMFMDRMESIQRGTSYPAVTDKDVKETIFTFPDIKDVQEDIISRLDEIKAKTQSLEFNYQQELDALDELKKSILQKAFNGEL
jgi:type I restriction enzyme S subunit